MPRYTSEQIHKQIHDLRHHLNDRLDKIERHIERGLDQIQEAILALTTGEQAAVDSLSNAVETLATDLDGVLQAAKDAQAKIQAFMDQDVVDAAEKAALQAIIDGMETDVVGALNPITDRLGVIDAGFHDPATPLTAS